MNNDSREFALNNEADSCIIYAHDLQQGKPPPSFTRIRKIRHKVLIVVVVAMTKQTFCLAVDRSLSFKNWEVTELDAEAKPPSEEQAAEDLKLQPPSLRIPANFSAPHLELELQQKQVFEFQSPRPVCELNAAATKLQKVYKSYRTRRNLADCAVVVEELWWKALDFASLRRTSVSFFNVEKPEPAVSKWARAKKRLARVGKGLSKNEKAQKLALTHWLEAIDPRHRYGHNLHLYYDVWFGSESTQPFFYWLDVGDGREVNLEECPRWKLQKQCITYLGPKEREAYEVIVEDGKLVYKKSETLVNTTEGSKWIFVLSTSRSLYVGKKMKGKFQHSSFLAGGATTAAGRLVAQEGTIQAIWPYSGHYLPTEDNFNEFISFLEDNEVNLSNVKRCSVDDDDYTSASKSLAGDQLKSAAEAVVGPETEPRDDVRTAALDPRNDTAAERKASPLARRASSKWTTAAGARISCVRDYPVDLQSLALEQVKLSPRAALSPAADKFKTPIPSPRPSPKLRLSPRLQRMAVLTPAALPSPRRSPKVRPSLGEPYGGLV